MNALTYNFWVGLTTVVLSAVSLTILRKWNLIQDFSVLFWLIAIITGGLVILRVAAKLLSYKGGGYIALKSLIMHSSFLILATLFGAIFYPEVLTLGKILGIFGFLIAFSLMNDDSWQYLSAKWPLKKLFNIGG